MKIIYPEHCGNSPKKNLLINIYKAVTESDNGFILNNLDDDIVLNIIGVKRIVSKVNIISTIEMFVKKGINEITINDAITHGNTAAVHGSVIFKDNLQIHFCDIYRFNGFGKNAKIKEINSYLINPSNHKIMV